MGGAEHWDLRESGVPRSGYKTECDTRHDWLWNRMETNLKGMSNHFLPFFQIYIEDRLLITFSVLLKSLVQIVIVILCLYTCVSRVTDNRHHASDVVAGGFLGIIVALYTVSLSLADPRGLLGRATRPRSHWRI